VQLYQIKQPAMKTTLLLFGISLFYVTGLFAQEKDTTTVKQYQFQESVKAINGKLHQLGDKADTLAASVKKINPGKTKADSTAEQLAKANPEIIYCPACKDGAKNCDACKKSVNYYSLDKIAAWLLLVLVWYFAIRQFTNSALCRDESYVKHGEQLVLRPETERPFSFARTQLFFWTMIIFTCYTAFYALYGTLLPLNSTAVILLGGGIATQLLGKTIDKTQTENNLPKPAAPGAAPAAPDWPARHQDVYPSKGLITDILSDDNGVSIHRLQLLVFNLIYGIAYLGFFFQMLQQCKYPLTDFADWQLMLLGVSAGGYLGIKTTENSKPTEPARRAEAARQEAMNRPEGGAVGGGV
jgi:hypothetical protein